MAFNAMPHFETADELKAFLPDNDWHASRSTVLIHLTTRWAVWKNMFDAWRGRRTATGPILGLRAAGAGPPRAVQRPTGGGAAAKGEGGRMTDDDDVEGGHPAADAARTRARRSTTRAQFLERAADEPSRRARHQPPGASSTGSTIGSVIFALRPPRRSTFRTLGVNLGRTSELIVSADVGLLCRSRSSPTTRHSRFAPSAGGTSSRRSGRGFGSAMRPRSCSSHGSSTASFRPSWATCTGHTC